MTVKGECVKWRRSSEGEILKKGEFKSSPTLGKDDKGNANTVVVGFLLREPLGGHIARSCIIRRVDVISRMIAVIYNSKPRYWFVALDYLNNSFNWSATD